MTIRERIGELLDRLHKPPDAVPIKPTWGDWAKGLMRSGMRSSMLAVLHFLEWIVQG